MRINVMSFKGSTGEHLLRDLEKRVECDLSRFGGRISRVEVLLMDDEDLSTDKSCIIEARLNDAAPIAVQAHASTFEHAIDKGAEKIEEVLHRRETEPKPQL